MASHRNTCPKLDIHGKTENWDFVREIVKPKTETHFWSHYNPTWSANLIRMHLRKVPKSHVLSSLFSQLLIRSTQTSSLTSILPSLIWSSLITVFIMKRVWADTDLTSSIDHTESNKRQQKVLKTLTNTQSLIKYLPDDQDTYKAHLSLMTSCTKTQQSVTLIDCPVIFAQWGLRAICTCPPLTQLHACEAPSKKKTLYKCNQQVVTTKQSILRSPWSIWLHSAQWPACCDRLQLSTPQDH